MRMSAPSTFVKARYTALKMAFVKATYAEKTPSIIVVKHKTNTNTITPTKVNFPNPKWTNFRYDCNLKTCLYECIPTCHQCCRLVCTRNNYVDFSSIPKSCKNKKEFG